MNVDNTTYLIYDKYTKGNSGYNNPLTLHITIDLLFKLDDVSILESGDQIVRVER